MGRKGASIRRDTAGVSCKKKNAQFGVFPPNLSDFFADFLLLSFFLVPSTTMVECQSTQNSRLTTGLPLSSSHKSVCSNHHSMIVLLPINHQKQLRIESSIHNLNLPPGPAFFLSHIHTNKYIFFLNFFKPLLSIFLQIRFPQRTGQGVGHTVKLVFQRGRPHTPQPLSRPMSTQ